MVFALDCIASRAGCTTEIIKQLWENAMIGKAAVRVRDRCGKVIPGEYTTLNLNAANTALIAIGKELGRFRDSKPEEADSLDMLTHEQVKVLKRAAEDLLNGTRH